MRAIEPSKLILHKTKKFQANKNRVKYVFKPGLEEQYLPVNNLKAEGKLRLGLTNKTFDLFNI